MDNIREEIKDIKIEVNEKLIHSDYQFEEINKRLDRIEANVTFLMARVGQKPHSGLFIAGAIFVLIIGLIASTYLYRSVSPDYKEIQNIPAQSSPQVSTGNNLQTVKPVKPDMVLIKGGTYEMGDSNSKFSAQRNAHKVTVDDFYMGKYEVTYREYVEFLNFAGNQKEEGVKWWFGDSYDSKDMFFQNTIYKVNQGSEYIPVAWVTWSGSVAYCNWLSDVEGLEKCYGDINNRGNVDITKNGYRLPTEAEWEYACRGGTKTDYFWGNENGGEYCWYKDNSQNHAHEVGKKKANPYGLFDMNGNLWEWCSDWFGYYSSENDVNPSGPLSGDYAGSHRTVRGGCYVNDLCSSSIGMPHALGDRYDGFAFGFRPVRSKI